MATGATLSDIWGLTAPMPGPDDSQSALFRKGFTKRIRELGARIESAMRFAEAGATKTLSDQRDRYFKDYNNIVKKIDQSGPEAAQDFIDALFTLMDKSILEAQRIDGEAMAAYLDWSETDIEFGGLVDAIEELESEGYADVGRLIQVQKIIEERVHQHRWAKAKEAVALLDPAVTKAEEAHDAAGGNDWDPDDIILLEDDRTERKFKRKFDKLFKKVDKRARRIIAMTDLNPDLADRRSAIEAEHELALEHRDVGAYSLAYENLSDAAFECDEFDEPYRAWAKAKKRCEKLLPKVTEAIARTEKIDAFNRELRSEMEQFDELKDLAANVTPLTEAFEFVKAELLLADLLQRCQHLQRRDLALEDQRQATALRDKLSADLEAVLEHPALAVLERQRDAVVARNDQVKTAMLGEKYPSAVKLLVKLEAEIKAFEDAKQAFDNKVAALQVRFAAADPAALNAEARKIVGEVSKAELSSLPSDFRDDLMKAVEQGEVGDEDRAAVSALEESEPMPPEEKDDLFDGRLDEAKQQFADFKKIPRRKQQLIQRQLVEAAKALRGIEKNVAAADFPAAEALLEGLEDTYDEARAALALFSGYPDPDLLLEVLDRDGGAAAFDKIVAGLPPGVPQKAFEQAIDLRFGMELELQDTEGDPEQMYDKKDQGLQEIYKMMAKVPEHHVVDNDMLSKIVRSSEAEGGGQWKGPRDGKGKGHIVLEAGRPSGKELEADFVDAAAEQIDPDAQRKAGAKQPKAFSFVALHEIGHAVDSQSQIMQSRMAKPAFGAWIDHRDDCSAIAEIAAKHFGFDSKQIEAWLKDEELDEADTPKAPEGKKEAAQWAKTRAKAEAWCKAVSLSNHLFMKGAKARKYAINGRIYQEAYVGQWVSYDVGARRQAVTNYQFRAPGEWFAELYAAYHSDQLKDSHPAVAWLKQLDTPEGTQALAAA